MMRNPSRAREAWRVLNLLVLALAAAFYPTLLAIVVLVLGRPRPKPLLFGYLIGGMVIGLGVGFTVVFVLKGVGANVGSGGHKSTASAVLDIAAGVLSLVLAWLLVTGRDPRPQRLRKERKPRDPDKPSFTTRAMSHDSVGLAFVLGIVLDLPSVWYVIALKDIAGGGYSTATEVILIIVFNVIMFAVIEIPLAAYLIAPERAAARAAAFNAWLHSHTRQIAQVLAGGVGVYLVVKGAVAL
jgi:hypothetical protein